MVTAFVLMIPRVFKQSAEKVDLGLAVRNAGLSAYLFCPLRDRPPPSGCFSSFVLILVAIMMVAMASCFGARGDGHDRLWWEAKHQRCTNGWPCFYR